MSKEELYHHWNYYESLSRRLENTARYVNHVPLQNLKSNEDDDVINAEITNNSTYSIEFEQIIVLAAVEFENVSKLLCREIDSNFNMKWASIVKITKTILDKYPRIIETEVLTYYSKFKPLGDWKISQRPNPDKPENSIDYVDGLEWWASYDDLKHQGYDVFYKANLNNAVKAVSSLFVLNLYLQKVVEGDLEIASSGNDDYFLTNYTSKVLATSEGQLPDFGDREA